MKQSPLVKGFPFDVEIASHKNARNDTQGFAMTSKASVVIANELLSE